MTIEQSMSLIHPRRHETQWHQHATGQLYWVRRGIIMVETDQAQHALTLGSVGWFPPTWRHRAWMPADSECHSLHLDAQGSAGLPAYPCVRAADHFLLLLLDKVLLAHEQAPGDPYPAHLLAVMTDEIGRAGELPLQLPLPADRRARQVAELLLVQPDCALNHEMLAQQSGLSSRTLSRLFSQQTGLSFSQWRQQARLIHSLAHLLQGDAVALVAGRCGYENVSAFIAAFRSRFALTPGQFQARQMR
ncbi:AraC family transcriptional regulator [Aeromonas lusitana]|uniref:AraC family transcriptional regulator n=2 Tax=Aeromonas lusitana TaxID=931529 RepID=A0A2M8HEQ2_9GAMM|nr:AraC family transcriptional regulator [Aeromonas lusitana]